MVNQKRISIYTRYVNMALLKRFNSNKEVIIGSMRETNAARNRRYTRKIITEEIDIGT